MSVFFFFFIFLFSLGHKVIVCLTTCLKVRPELFFPTLQTCLGVTWAAFLQGEREIKPETEVICFLVDKRKVILTVPTICSRVFFLSSLTLFKSDQTSCFGRKNKSSELSRRSIYSCKHLGLWPLCDLLMLAQTTWPSLVPSSSSRWLRMLIRSDLPVFYKVTSAGNYTVTSVLKSYQRWLLYPKC